MLFRDEQESEQPPAPAKRSEGDAAAPRHVVRAAALPSLKVRNRTGL
jgi:hypothetical protein